MIEIEKRGQFKNDQKYKLLQFLVQNAKPISNLNSLTIFIEFDNPYLGSVENTKASISVAFVRDLLTSEINCKLKAKLGRMESSARKEIEIPFSKDKIQDIYSFLEIFGVTTGCPRFYHRQDFEIDNVTVTLKEGGLAPDHFEVEVTVDTEDEITNGEKLLDLFISQHGLTYMSEDNYKEVMLKVFKDNPPIPLKSIDLLQI